MADNERAPSEAEVPASELEDMIRDSIEIAMRPDVAGRALVHWEKIEDLLAVLREEMPELLREFDL